MAGIWPRLRKKLSGGGERKKNKSKANPFSASELEKFATLLEGIQSTKASSLVERTASSLSAARSISRSAQEWTATSLRSASWRNFEPKLVQCPAFEALAPKPATLPIVGNLEDDLKNSSDERQPQGSHSHASIKEVSSSAPVGVRLPVRTSRCRSMKKVQSLHQQGSRQTSKSAFVVVVAMGAFISSRFANVEKPLAAVLTFSAVIRIWRKGKVSARFIFSSVALYFLTRLKSYLVTRIPSRLSLLSLEGDLKVTSSTNAMEESTRISEVDFAKQQQDSNLGFLVMPLESAFSGAVVVKESSPLSILLPIPESNASSQLAIGSLPMTSFRKIGGSTSSSRRLAKRISSKFKRFKMLKSLSSFSSSSRSHPSLSVSESPHHSDAAPEPNSPTSPSSLDRRRMCPFSRSLHKTKSSDVTDQLVQNEEFISRSSSSKCIVMRRQRSSDSMVCKKSKLGRILSSETLEQYNISDSIPFRASSPLHGKSTSSSSTNAEDTANIANKSRNDFSWSVVGLLVTLLFLLLGHFPAIMATSLFFVVVSNAHYERAHLRGRCRDNRALEAARKLQRSSPPRGHRWAVTSPPRRF